jgi:hypothetical protein
VRKKKASNSPMSLTKEFLECIHYDQEVPVENSVDVTHPDNLNDGD